MKENVESTLSIGEQPASSSKTADSRYDSQTLFCGQQEILIEHAGHAYRLRITRQNKLILTK
ncbi:MAG: hemin uptake protein HemP [Gammaproteobacteria bacterium]